MVACAVHGDRDGKRCPLCKADCVRARIAERERRRSAARADAVREAMARLPESKVPW